MLRLPRTRWRQRCYGGSNKPPRWRGSRPDSSFVNVGNVIDLTTGQQDVVGQPRRAPATGAKATTEEGHPAAEEWIDSDLMEPPPRAYGMASGHEDKQIYKLDDIIDINQIDEDHVGGMATPLRSSRRATGRSRSNRGSGSSGSNGSSSRLSQSKTQGDEATAR